MLGVNRNAPRVDTPYDASYEPRLCPRACWTFDSRKYTPMIRRSFFCDGENAAGGRQRRLHLNANSALGRESLIFSVHINRNIVRSLGIQRIPDAWNDVIFTCAIRSSDVCSAQFCKRVTDKRRSQSREMF